MAVGWIAGSVSCLRRFRVRLWVSKLDVEEECFGWCSVELCVCVCDVMWCTNNTIFKYTHHTKGDSYILQEIIDVI